MVWLVILFAISYLQGCGASVDEIDKDVRTNPVVHGVFGSTYVNSDLQDTVDTFLADCPAADLSSIRSIDYGNVRDSDNPYRVGVCYFGDSVVIHADYEYRKPHPAILRMIVYHELGHCLLGLEHTPEMSGNSIMNPRIALDRPDYYDGVRWDNLVTTMCGG